MRENDRKFTGTRDRENRGIFSKLLERRDDEDENNAPEN